MEDGLDPSMDPELAMVCCLSAATKSIILTCRPSACHFKKQKKLRERNPPMRRLLALPPLHLHLQLQQSPKSPMPLLCLTR